MQSDSRLRVPFFVRKLWPNASSQMNCRISGPIQIPAVILASLLDEKC